MTGPASIDTDGAVGGDSIAATVSESVTTANAWADANERAQNNGSSVSSPGGGGDEYAPLT